MSTEKLPPFTNTCSRCKRKFESHGIKCCDPCRENLRLWRSNNMDKVRKRRKVYRQKHLEEINRKKKLWVKTAGGQKCRTATMWKYKTNLRSEMIAAYGGCCSCCGEREYQFLTLEHKLGGGFKHRKETSGSLGAILDAKRNGWPRDLYTVLCWNCNMSVRFGRECPHKRKNLLFA